MKNSANKNFIQLSAQNLSLRPGIKVYTASGGYAFSQQGNNVIVTRDATKG